jgi:hypothetical protein
MRAGAEKHPPSFAFTTSYWLPTTTVATDYQLLIPDL